LKEKNSVEKLHEKTPGVFSRAFNFLFCKLKNNITTAKTMEPEVKFANMLVQNRTDENCNFSIYYYKGPNVCGGYQSLHSKAKENSGAFIRRNLSLLKDVPFYPRTKKALLFIEIEEMIEKGIDLGKVNTDLKKGFAENPIETTLKFAKDVDSLIRANIAFLIDYEKLLSFNLEPRFQKITNCKEDIAFVLSALKKCAKPSAHDFLFAYVNFSPFELLMMGKLEQFYLPCFFFANSETNLEMSKTHNTTIKIDLRSLNQKPFQLQTGQFGDDVLFLPFTRFQFQSFDRTLGVLELAAQNSPDFHNNTVNCDENSILKKIPNDTLQKMQNFAFGKWNDLKKNIEILHNIEKILKEDLCV